VHVELVARSREASLASLSPRILFVLCCTPMSKDNGHDPLSVQMVEILGKIHHELVNVRGAMGELRADVQATNTRLDATNTRLDATNTRLDTLHEDVVALRAEVTGIRNEVQSLRQETRVELEGIHEELRDDLGARVRRLEEAVFKRAS
jgi:chromosome segregation ATPase